MRKKLFAMYALVGALVASPIFTSCVDDNESASVSSLRGAKAEQLKAAAALANAQAAAETTLANAEAQFKAAEAAYWNALAEAEKANAEYQKELTKQAQEKFALEIQTLQAQAEKDLLELQKTINDYKNDLADADYNRFSTLYNRYVNELDELIRMQRQLVSDKNQLARLEANVITTEAFNQYQIKTQERNIAAYEAQIALLKDPAYAALDENELRAKYLVAEKEVNLAQTAFNASEEVSKLLAAHELINDKNEEMDKLQNIISDLNYKYVYYGIVAYQSNTLEVRINSENGYRNNWYNYYYDYYYNIRIDETTKLQITKYYENNVKNYADQIGKADDTKDKNTAYGSLAAANADLTAAKAMPETTDAEKAAKETAIETAEFAIAQATDYLAMLQGWYNDAVEEQTKFNETLAAFDIAAANKLADEMIAANEANDLACEAWEEAYKGIDEKWNVYSAIVELYFNASSDIEQQILSLEQNIAACKANIEGYKVNSDEQTLANAKEDIANLEAKIAVQEKVVADAKAAVDAYLVTEGEGEEEETPAE